MAKQANKKLGNPSWVKGGASPNPGGRPSVLGDLREAARQYSQESLEILASVMRDREAPPAARVTAARELLDRGFGRPIQSVDVSGKVDMGQTAAQALMSLAAAAREKTKGIEGSLIDITPTQ